MTDTLTTGTAPTATDDTGIHIPASGFSGSSRERGTLDLWIDLVHVTTTVHARLTERLAFELGMLPEEVELLMRLAEAPEHRLRMAHVSRALLLSKSGVTRLVDRVAERRLVERAACPSDRRVVYAGLTDEGRRVVAQAAPLVAAGVDEHLGRHLEQTELNALWGSLRKILAAQRQD